MNGPFPECRPTRSLEATRAIIEYESALKGLNPDEHPALNWWHCAHCRTWHPTDKMVNPTGP